MKRIVVIYLILASFGNILAQKNNDPATSGKLVDAGGHKLHLNITGKGGPTVVLENGSFDFSFIWALVQPKISGFAQTVSYDRAGYAWSESGPLPRSGEQLAFELHTALINAGIKGPYILVGQSFGGFLVRNFARLYPKDVVGMVLVDALNEDERININGKMTRVRELAEGRQQPPVVKHSNKAETDQTDSLIMNAQIEPPLDKLPADVQQLQSWAQCKLRFVNAGRAEMDWSPEDVAVMYKNRGNKDFMLGSIPLVVICKSEGGYEGMTDAVELENDRLRLQKELAHLSTNGKLIIDKKSGHNIHLEDPETVVDAVKQVVEAVRNNSKL